MYLPVWTCQHCDLVGLYFSNSVSLEAMGDDSCNSSADSLWSNLLQYAAVKTCKDGAILDISETVLGKTNSEFRSLSDSLSNEFENEYTILQEVHYVYLGEKLSPNDFRLC
jgi:hypothetical protein